MEKEQDWSYSPYIPGSEYYSPERRSEIREGARKLRRQYLRYKEAEIIYSMSHKKLLELAGKAGAILRIDADPQGSLTISLGYPDPDELPVTLATIMTNIIEENDMPDNYGMLHHQEGIELIPANMELSGIEVSLANTMSREMILKEYIEMIRDRFDYILIDCMPSLGVMTINALVAADRVLIPVQSSYLPVKGLQMLLKTISVVKND